MDNQVAVYYIGGPWDLHKVASNARALGDRELVRVVAKPLVLEDGADLKVVDHTYRVLPVADGVFDEEML